MERFIDQCCAKCTHTKDSPCRDFVECCLNGPLCHEDPACAAARKAIIERVALNEKFVIF
ncbi:MAG TPA: CCxxC motif-containing NuoF prefix domain-containing protein [Bacillota bacterium]|nr:CCxxC motif-containing NuoF prefix domain-containing protein [Bacillota bacterium]